MGEPHFHRWLYKYTDPSDPKMFVYRCECGLKTSEVATVPAPQGTQQTLTEFLAMRLRDIEVLFEGYLFEETYTNKEHERRESLRYMIYNLQFVLEWHDNWPVLVEQPMPEITRISPNDEMRTSLNRYSYEISVRMAWFTQNQYLKFFGTEPPTAPILKHMAQHFQNHPHFNPAWL